MATGAIVVDVPRWTKELQAYAREYGLNIALEMRHQAVLWVKALIRHTPHKSATRREIAKKIDRDMTKVFGQIRTERNIKFLRRLAGDEIDIFKPVDMDAEMKNRRSRNGKVRARSHSSVTIEKRGKNYQFTDKPYVTRRQFDRHRKKLKLRSGLLASGFIAALYRFKGRLPPFWITRHGSNRGDAMDAMRQDGTGFIQFRTKVDFRVSQIQSTFKFVAKLRNQVWVKGLKRKMDEVAKKHSTI